MVHVSMSYGFMALLLMMISIWCAEAMAQQLEMQQLLKRLNKPAVKSIKSPDGDIIDCVHISHQPAFDHPLLKNHTIQMRPSFHPLGLYDDNKMATKMETKSIPQIWHQNGRCPEDTIPIRRNKKDDVLRASSVERYGKKRHQTIRNHTSEDPNDANIVHEHALAFVKGGNHYGTRATLNVWNPKLESPSEFSLSQLRIVGANGDQTFDTIEAGWQVYPVLYGDNKTRLFIYWTQDGYQSTGCYNLLCPGFVQVNKEIALGASIYPISSYDGDQYEITLLAWKDPNSGNWWLQHGKLSPLGYWPSSLFPYLTNGGSLVEWGGEIVPSNSNGPHTSTQMGSGHFPEEGYGKSSYIKDIQIVDQSNHLQVLQQFDTFVRRPNCYNMMSDLYTGYIYYGGPGRNPNCP